MDVLLSWVMIAHVIGRNRYSPDQDI